MTLALWFWIFMALYLLGSFWVGWRPAPEPPNGRYWAWGGSLLLFLILLVLGLHAFGGPIKG